MSLALIDVIRYIGICALLFGIRDGAGANAVLWSWILTNPGAGEPGVPSINSKLGPKWLAEGPRQGNKSGGTPLRHHRHQHGAGLVFCSEDHTCGRGKFCDHHYGICDSLRKEGDHCRRDHHCEHGLECMYGRCRKQVKKSERGSRCYSDSDCERNMCCARQHGEFVCKPRLPVGHKCFVPSGGLEYILNEVCPCEHGLVCKHTKIGPHWMHKRDTENIRCSLQ